jgi:hypothetical protein
VNGIEDDPLEGDDAPEGEGNDAPEGELEDSGEGVGEDAPEGEGEDVPEPDGEEPREGDCDTELSTTRMVTSTSLSTLFPAASAGPAPNTDANTDPSKTSSANPVNGTKRPHRPRPETTTLI